MKAKYFNRLVKEKDDINNNYKGQFEIISDPNNYNEWRIKFLGAPGTIYAGEPYTLKFAFGANYPMESPEVIFIGTAPIHPHIYSNGFICLSILYKDWSPALKVSSLCLSILSMMSSCTKKERPPGHDSSLSYFGGKSPKQVSWAFEDDKI